MTRTFALRQRSAATLAAALVAVTGALLASAPTVSARSAVTPLVSVLSGGTSPVPSGQTAAGDYATAAVGDLQGGGATDVVAAFRDGTVHAWNLATHRQFLDVNLRSGSITASPAIVTVDGHPAILDATLDGLVFLLRANGSYLFRAHLTASNGGSAAVFATPAIAYLDATSEPWIVVSSWGQRLFALNLAGHEHSGFPYFFQDSSWSSPAIAYFNHSRYPSIVVGYDCGGAPPQLCTRKYHASGGFVTVINHDGAVESGWPYFVRGQTVWSSPAVGDLLDNGGQQIVVGTGNYWPSGGEEVIALTPNGKLVPGWPARVNARVFSSPAIADWGGHGYAAVVTDSGDVDLLSSTGHVLWSQCPFRQSGYSGCPNSLASVAFADVTDLGQPQVIGASNIAWRAFTLGGAVAAAGQVVGSISLSSAPTVTQFNGHAVLLYASTETGGHGSDEVAAFTFPNRLGALPWGTFKHDNQRTGDQSGN